MSDEQKQPVDPESNGGSGDVYSEGVKRDRMERKAIKQRWPFPEKYREPIMKRAITKLIDPNTSDRNFNQTFNALLRAEAQNQADEHKQQPDEVNINLTGGVRIMTDKDWYGNSDRLDAIAAAASGPDPDGPGPVQGGGGRPPLGKNGDGTPGSD